jgi:putative ABC transport system permease protein
MLRDVRLAARLLRKHPGFSALAVVPLALGIGATAAVFSLIQGVLLTPPPYRDADGLALVPIARAPGQETAPNGWAPAQWMDWQAHASSFDGVAAYGWSFNFLMRDEGSQSIEGMVVTEDYFQLLGLQPLLGRTFVASEIGPNSTPAIIIGYDLWQRAFGGDPAILGKPLRMSRRENPPVIVGVMPPGIRFLPVPRASKEPNYDVNALVDFWSPGAPDPQHLTDAGWNVVARLKGGVSAADAQAELATLTTRQAAVERGLRPSEPRVVPLRTDMNRDGRRVLLPLLGAAALVLLIACGNTAALLLVRGLQRQQEYAIRIAIGIHRRALVVQAVTESLLLALLAGALGLGLGVTIVQVMRTIGAHAIPRMDAVRVDWRVVVVALGVSAGAAVLAAVVPALRAARVDPNDALKSAGPRSSGGRADRRLLGALTIAQTALTLALLVGAGLLVRSMHNVWQAPAGFATDHILTMTVTAVQGNWLDFHQRALERVGALAGVRHAAFAWGVPLTGTNWPGFIEIEGHPVVSPTDRVAMPLRSVTPGYFALLGIPIVDGRDFSAADARDAAPVAIVNRRLVAQYFEGRGAIGRRLWLNGRERPPARIIGVVGDTRPDDLTQQAEPEVYLPLWQASAFSKDLILRTDGDPRAAFTDVQRELRAIDPTVAIENVRTLDQIRLDSVSSRTFAARLLIGFSGVAIVLTLVGVYGVLSLTVASRRREFAIRSAIGAQRGDIRRLVAGEGLRLVGWGLAAGIAAALALGRVWRVFLYGVQPSDPVTLAVAALLFIGVSALACWIPTRRATAIDPLEALRSE